MKPGLRRVTGIVGLLLLPLVSACAGGGANTAVPSGSSLPGSATHAAQANRAAPTSTPIPYSSDLLYIANSGSNSITVYPHDVSGNTAPKYVIAGSKTGITNPGDLSEDAAGNLYVANKTSLLVFAHGASGNVAPISVLAGPATGIGQITAMTVDQSTGKIFIGSIPANGNPYSATLLRFPPQANGNTAPFQTKNLNNPINAMTSDSSGQFLIDATNDVEEVGRGIEFDYKQFPSLPPAGSVLGRLDGGINAVSIVDDPTTKTYLVSGFIGGVGSGIIRFAEDTVGSGAYDGAPAASFNPAMVSQLNVCANIVRLGYLRNIYTTCDNAMNVYEHDAAGNAAPIRVLSGSLTKINNPVGLYEGK